MVDDRSSAVRGGDAGCPLLDGCVGPDQADVVNVYVDRQPRVVAEETGILTLDRIPALDHFACHVNHAGLGRVQRGDGLGVAGVERPRK